MHQPTDTFPKTGRVTEACKEWLVREDNALAQHLQTQEINEHYKGNRYRNQVVREDFPTALNAQKQEELTASQQSALYYKMIDEQEQTDALVAKELARKLKWESQQNKQNQVECNDMMAQQSQENKSGNFKIPFNELPIPPKNNNHKVQHQLSDIHSIVSEQNNSIGNIKSRLNYVSLDLDNPLRINRAYQTQSQDTVQYSQILPATSSNCSPPSTREYIHLQSHTPEKQYQRNIPSSEDILDRFKNNDYRELYELPINRNMMKISANKTSQLTYIDSPDKMINSAASENISDLNLDNSETINDMMCNPHFNYAYQSIGTSNQKMQFSPGIDSHLHRNIPSQHVADKNVNSSVIADTTNIIQIDSDQNPDYVNCRPGISKEIVHKLSPEKFDQLMGNKGDQLKKNVINENGDSIDGAHAFEQICVNRTNDGIDYENIDRIKQMEEFGVPPEEIIEIDRRLTQEQRDEELARLLQQEENKTVSFEERDRIVAMEAQDKELARMLQERERAKAKRAKERAKERARMKRLEQDEHEENLDNITVVPNNHSRSHSIDNDSYSDPVDLLPKTQSNRDHYQRYQGSLSSQDNDNSMSCHDPSLLSTEENYSNPIDLIKMEQQLNSNIKNQPYSTRKDEDIYQLPVATESDAISRPVRPNNLDIRGPLHRPNVQRSQISDGLENIAAIIDPTYEHGNTTNSKKLLSSSPSSSLSAPSAAAPTATTTTPQSTMGTLPDFLDQGSSPVPPYMPIQGTRRNTSLENKKKKSKDICTHQ